MKIRIECVMWKSGQFTGRRRAIISVRQCDAQDTRCMYGVFTKGFIKITYTE
jgi:hypothetical protein